MHKYILSVIFASLLMLGGAAQAANICDTLGDYPEAAFCEAYCVAMNCDLTDENGETSSSQASAAACSKVATNFISFLDLIPRSEVDPVAAMDTLDNDYCTCTGGGCPPGGGV